MSWVTTLKKFFNLSILPSVLLIAALGTASAALPDKSQPDFTPLHTLATQNGSVRVIVALDVDVLPEGKLSSTFQIQNQRDHINQAQNSISTAVQGKASALRNFSTIPFMALTVTPEALEILQKHPQVTGIYQDQRLKANLDQSVPLIGAPQAWAEGYSGSGQVVAILDTGVDKFHPFLQNKIVDEACFSTESSTEGANTLCPNGQESQTGQGAGVNCSTSYYGCDHGTHVAGIAVGANEDFQGVAKDAQALAVQIFSRFDDTLTCGGSYYTPCVESYTSDVIRGLEWVYEQRDNYTIAAANLSLGGSAYSSYCDQVDAATKAVIDNLRSVGIATVIASGNESQTAAISSPSCISTAISVGSTTKSDTVSTFSNSAYILDLLAPGSDITSSVPGTSYESFDGTSMAAPHVTGAWAILKSKKPDASVDEVLAALRNNGEPIVDSRNQITSPRIDLAQAIEAFGDTPLITSDNYVEGYVDEDFSYQIVATNNPTSYTATNLPAWLQLDSDTGLITGHPEDVDVYTFDIEATNAAGSDSLTLTMEVLPARPTNDDFINSIQITNFSEEIIASNTTATAEDEEPIPSCFADAGDGVEASVWWTFTSGTNGEIQLSTENSTFDTELAVFSGDALDNLTELGCNDDYNYPNDRTSRVTFTANTGETYYIMVDGWGGDTGEIHLTISGAGEKPQITSNSAATAYVGEFFEYAIQATQSPSYYSVVWLPEGLFFDSEQGRILGVPTTSGTYQVLITAANDYGSTTMALTIVVDTAAENTGEYRPVYRFYNTETGGHFYTQSVTERNSIMLSLPQLSYEGEGFVAASTQLEGLLPVYRFFNTRTSTHFFTISETEKDYVINNLSEYNFENVGWYAKDQESSGMVPVYRFYNSVTGTHFFTIQESERDWIQTYLPDMQYEGTPWYVWSQAPE